MITNYFSYPPVQTNKHKQKPPLQHVFQHSVQTTGSWTRSGVCTLGGSDVPTIKLSIKATSTTCFALLFPWPDATDLQQSDLDRVEKSYNRHLKSPQTNSKLFLDPKTLNSKVFHFKGIFNIYFTFRIFTHEYCIFPISWLQHFLLPVLLSIVIKFMTCFL